MGPSWAFSAEGGKMAQFRQRQAKKEVRRFAVRTWHNCFGVKDFKDLPRVRTSGSQVRTLVRTPLMVRTP